MTTTMTKTTESVEIPGFAYLVRTPDGGTAWAPHNTLHTVETRKERSTRAAAKEAARASKSKRIFGKYTVTAVLRYMGANGWTNTDAACALGQIAAVNTIRAQIHAGRHGRRGAPAPLTTEEVKILADTRGKETLLAYVD